jgi:F-type H+-transporting ATPase subunit b
MQVTQESITLIVCQIALFLALFAVLKRFWFAPVESILHERAHRSESALQEAHDAQARAEELRGEHARALDAARAQAQGEIQDLLRAAESEQKRLIDAAQADAERTLADARQGIARDVAQAKAQLEGEVAELARRAAESVLGRPLR